MTGGNTVSAKGDKQTFDGLRAVNKIRQGIIYFFNTTTALIFVAALVWYLPFLALACGMLVAVVFGVPRLRNIKWPQPSLERKDQWAPTLIEIGRFSKALLYTMAIIGGLGAIYFWYPFQSIGNIPLVRVTLNQIFVNLGGVFVVGAVLIWATVLARIYRKMGDLDFHQAGQNAVVMAFVVFALFIMYLLYPSFVEETYQSLRSAF